MTLNPFLAVNVTGNLSPVKIENLLWLDQIWVSSCRILLSVAFTAFSKKKVTAHPFSHQKAVKVWIQIHHFAMRLEKNFKNNVYWKLAAT